jgi:hypothetical protein
MGGNLRLIAAVHPGKRTADGMFEATMTTCMIQAGEFYSTDNVLLFRFRVGGSM